MDDITLNTVNEVQEPVVETPNPAEVTSGVATGNEHETKVAEEVAKPQQTAEDNAKFAAMRREAEAAKREAARLKADQERIARYLSDYGYSGSAQEIADALEAEKAGTTPEVIREERNKRLEAEAAKNTLEHELEELKRFKYEKTIEADIAEIKKAYPDAPGSISELSPDFINIMATGAVDAVTAYEIVRAREAKATKTPPQELGSVSTAAPEKNHFTREEVQKMSQAEVSKHYEKIKKSMSKW